ncbi:MAG TPA: hypothetical protein VFF33_14045 [Ignavibacteriaceae bacterium]|nr:hypothetical protein [Ignavibacteriaceae bacterium]
MIKINDADGKTKENPIVILEAADSNEGWIFIFKYIEDYMQYHGYDNYDYDDIVDTFDLELREFKFIKDGKVVDYLYIDWTTLFHVWDK